MPNYLLINKQTNIVDNIIDWDGNTSTWRPPEEYEVVAQSEGRLEIIWDWDKERQEWVELETFRGGDIGATWDGTKFINPKPTWTPEPPIGDPR